MATVITGTQQIANARLLTLRVGLGLELLGMKRRGKSCYAIIKADYGFRGNRASVYAQFKASLVKAGILA